jgi:hypothetical protein
MIKIIVDMMGKDLLEYIKYLIESPRTIGCKKFEIMAILIVMKFSVLCSFVEE